jgi:hypothetical protein
MTAMKRLATLLLILPMGLTAQEIRTPTFTKDVAPIVFAACAECHRPGEVAPFPLLSYADVKKRTKQILAAAEQRRMPPWKPIEGHGDFAGERRMKAEDIALLRTWVEAGAVEGDPKDLPALPKFTDGWLFGEPDLIVQMPEAMTVPAEGRDLYRAFAIPLNLTEDKYLRATQFRPKNPKTVHHSLFFLDLTGNARKQDAADPEPGFKGQGLSFGDTIGGWTPGGVSHPWPDGMGKIIKKNADILLQLHLSPTGKEEKEQSQIGLWFAKERPRKIVMSLPLMDIQFDLPANAKDLQVPDSIVLPVDVELIGVIPHAHYLARDCRVWAKDPDQKEIPLLWIKDWDFDWQEQYRYRKSLHLRQGTELNMVWTYDNTTSNPRQPSKPPQRVRFGERTVDEMAVVVLHVAISNPLDQLKIYGAMLNKQKGK